MARLRLILLGAVRIGPAAGLAINLPSRKAQALLAFLGLRPGRPHARAKLAALLWGETGEEQARSSLRQTLMTLRRALPRTRPPLLLAVGDTLAINPAAIDVDVAAFERRVAEGTPGALARAAALYRGDLLEGLAVAEAPFEEWLTSERERLQQLALRALTRLLEHQLAAGLLDDALPTASRLLALDPLREAAHRALMHVYTRQGLRGSALRQYQTCVATLQRELGADPEPVTQQLYRHIVKEPTPGAPSAASSHHRAARARGGTSTSEAPLVGRATELERLRHALDAAWQGRGHALVLVGEAGIGKTRLLDRVAAEAAQRGARLLAARAHETERALPFRPWVDALRAGRALSEPAAIDALPRAWRQELSRLFAELGEPAGPLSAAPQESVRLLEAVTAFLGELAKKTPVVLVLDDLHWADEMSVQLLDFVARRIADRPVLLLGSAREEELPLLGQADRERAWSLLTLAPLSRSDTAALVRALARTAMDATAVTRIGRRVWALSEGNPFVITETMRGVQEGMAETPEDLPVPQRVRDVVAARLDRLSPLGQHLLAVAAVIGRAFSVQLLQRAAGLGEPETVQGLEELVRRRVLHAEGERFDVTHERIRAVAAERLLEPRRRVLHAAVLEALETLYAERAEEIYDRLAHHAARADDAEKTVRYLLRLSERAARRYALEEAMRALREARPLAERLSGPERHARVLDVLVALASSQYFLGRFRDILDLVLPECDRFERLGDPALSGPLHFWIGYTHGLLGDPARAWTSLQRALDDATRAGDRATMGRAHCGLARECFWSGRLKEGIDHGRQAVELLDRPVDRWWLGHAYWALGINYAFAGQLDRALEAQVRAATIGTSLADSRLQCFAAWATALVHHQSGDWTAAIEAASRSLERSTDAINTALANGYLGRAWLGAGDVACAITLLEESTRQVAALHMERSLGQITIWLAEACLAGGHTDRAGELATAGRRSTESSGHRYAIGDADRVLGRIALARGEYAEAEARLGAALATFTEIGARLQAARTHQALAEVARERGHAAADAAHQAEARQLLAALGVPGD